MPDILFKTDEYVFSYRVGAICIQNGCVLLQKPDNDPGYALPGGHVAFGEETKDTLKRELKEEIGADVEVGKLRWVAEIFFPWGNRPCHQICMYYDAVMVSVPSHSSLPYLSHSAIFVPSLPQVASFTGR